MSDRNFMALIALIIVAVVGSIVLFGGSENSASSGTFIGDPLKVADGFSSEDGATQRADHVVGPNDAAVTFIEYADFSCPACAGFYPVLNQLKNAYPDDVQFVYRHNPLSSIHPNAFAAHRAAVAAANQGKFWEMHDLMYERQAAWTAQFSGLDVSAASAVFENYATELGLDIEKFNNDVESIDTFNFIDSHLDSGSQLNVTGTPTIFINGDLVEERTFEELSNIIDEIVAGDGAAETSGTEEVED